MSAIYEYNELVNQYNAGGDVGEEELHEAYYRAYPEDREHTYNADESLYARIRARLGLPDDALIDVREEEWDFGFCDTCSSPEDGFSVYANGVQVWPSENKLRDLGGVAFADDQGFLTNENLTVYGEFNEWLNGKGNWGDE